MDQEQHVEAVVRFGRLAGNLDVALVDIAHDVPGQAQVANLLLLAITAGWVVADSQSPVDADLRWGAISAWADTKPSTHLADLPPQLIQWTALPLQWERRFSIYLSYLKKDGTPRAFHVGPEGFHGRRRSVEFFDGRRRRTAKLSHEADLSFCAAKLPDILYRWMVVSERDSEFAAAASELGSATLRALNDGQVTAREYERVCAELAWSALRV
jgi:hypothetical protein